MVGPERLRPIGEVDGLEGLSSGMAAGKGAVPRRMPVLGQHHVLEALAEPVHQRDNLVAAGHRERAARAEIVLHVDDEENVGFRETHERTPFSSLFSPSPVSPGDSP
jgi:hypothetical protein